MSVLDEILVGVRADVAARQAAVPLDELKLKAASGPRRPTRCVRAQRDAVAVIAEVKRRSPSRGELAPDHGPGLRSRASTGRRRRGHQRADRAAPVRRLARRPRRRARPGRRARAAQGLHRITRTSVGGARLRRRHGAAHRRRARAERAGRPRRAGRVARHDPAGRGARRGRGRPGPGRRRAGHRRQRPRPAHPRGRPHVFERLRPGIPRAS